MHPYEAIGEANLRAEEFRARAERAEAMGIFEVTGWSRVPGDRAYVEGANAEEAIARVRQDLIDNHGVDDMDERPASSTLEG